MLQHRVCTGTAVPAVTILTVRFMQMMTMCGDADGMVSGATHTTAATIRPGLQVLRTKDSPLVSSVFFMCLPDKVCIPQATTANAVLSFRRYESAGNGDFAG